MVPIFCLLPEMAMNFPRELLASYIFYAICWAFMLLAEMVNIQMEILCYQFLLGRANKFFVSCTFFSAVPAMTGRQASTEAVKGWSNRININIIPQFFGEMSQRVASWLLLLASRLTHSAYFYENSLSFCVFHQCGSVVWKRELNSHTHTHRRNAVKRLETISASFWWHSRSWKHLRNALYILHNFALAWITSTTVDASWSRWLGWRPIKETQNGIPLDAFNVAQQWASLTSELSRPNCLRFTWLLSD